MIHEALQHFDEDPDGRASCTSVSFHLLVGKNPPRPEFTEALYHGCWFLEEMGVLAAIEQYEHGVYTTIYAMEDTQKPSQFFWEMHRTARHENPHGFYAGGLVRSYIYDSDKGGIISHVFGVASVHENRKVTIVDIAPTREDRKNYAVSKVQIARLDDRVAPIERGVIRALGLIGEPLDGPSFASPKRRRQVEEEYTAWKRYAQGFLEAAEIRKKTNATDHVILTRNRELIPVKR